MATGTIPLTGMPDELAAVVCSYDEPRKHIIVTNWALIGPEQRQRYCDEIGRSRWWFRRWRAEVIAARLSR